MTLAAEHRDGLGLELLHGYLLHRRRSFAGLVYLGLGALGSLLQDHEASRVGLERGCLRTLCVTCLDLFF